MGSILGIFDYVKPNSEEEQNTRRKWVFGILIVIFIIAYIESEIRNERHGLKFETST